MISLCVLMQEEKAVNILQDMNIGIYDLMICLLIKVPFGALKANVKQVDNFPFFPVL